MKLTSIPKLGDIGPDVLVLQTALKAKGFDPGTLDGDYGKKTNAAVIKAQKAAKLPGGGIIGPRTLSFLGLVVMVPAPIPGTTTVTRDLKGKKDRFLHPKLRLAIEANLFTGGMIPVSFSSLDLPQMVVDTALAMEKLSIREVGGNNRGQKVGWIQSVVGSDSETGNGDSWCMSTDQNIIAFIEDYIGVESPLIASENCMAVKRAAETVPGLFVKEAKRGSFFLMGYTSTTGHTGTVLEVLPKNKMKTYEGNTGSGSVNDGNGAFLRERPASGKIGKGTIHGFAFVYPNNVVPNKAV